MEGAHRAGEACDPLLDASEPPEECVHAPNLVREAGLQRRRGAAADNKARPGPLKQSLLPPHQPRGLLKLLSVVFGDFRGEG